MNYPPLPTFNYGWDTLLDNPSVDATLACMILFRTNDALSTYGAAALRMTHMSIIDFRAIS